MMFKNRRDAGLYLAKELVKYEETDALVLAIPRGGIEVGKVVADELNLDFDILISRKLPLPHNPEAGFGAITEDGGTFLYDDTATWLDADTIDRIIDEQYQVVRDRISTLRKSRPLTDLHNRIVILIDDGLAMGSTMRGSLKYCQKQNPQRLVVAVPVSGERTAREISQIVDEVVVVEIPEHFRAVAQVYQNWHDVSNEEALEILENRV